MTHAADSAARQAAYGESEREQTATEAGEVRSGTSSHLPVFAAFVELGLTGRDVAEFADVTAPTVSKWRTGKVRIPGERLAFLSLVLAHLLDEAPKQVGGADWNDRLNAAKAYLVLQDVLNRELAVGEVRDGAQLFRAWWMSGAAARLQEKRFAGDGREELWKDMRTRI